MVGSAHPLTARHIPVQKEKKISDIFEQSPTPPAKFTTPNQHRNEVFVSVLHTEFLPPSDIHPVPMGVKNAAGAKRKAPVGRSGPVGSPKKARLQADRMDIDGDSDAASDSDSDMDDFSDDSDDGGVKLTPAPKNKPREKEEKGRKEKAGDRKAGDKKSSHSKEPEKGMRAPLCPSLPH